MQPLISPHSILSVLPPGGFLFRNATPTGEGWDKDITVVYRNSSLTTKEYHACQQPAPVVDKLAKKVFLMTSLDNWHVRLQSSSDDGVSWTPSADSVDLDASLRKPGWGMIFTGLPGGIQLVAPNPHAGRLVLCTSFFFAFSLYLEEVRSALYMRLVSRVHSSRSQLNLICHLRR
jgi:hypothetical protein